jgi:hypothetical protein
LANRFREIDPPAEAKRSEAQGNQPQSTANENLRGRKRPPVRRKGVVAKALSSVFSGTFLAQEKSLQHLPFVLFLACLAVLYIANGYYADDKVREANKLGNQLKELRSEYISTKSELMFASKQSEVAKAAAVLGLKEPLVPPIKIAVDSSQIHSALP